MGVLVAVSIPIFTSQLQKARLATNQANARAAYAAVEAQYLLDDTKTGNYTYDASKGQLKTAADTDAVAISKTDISSWETTDKVGTGSDTLGSKTYTSWTLTVGTEGTVTAYAAK